VGDVNGCCGVRSIAGTRLTDGYGFLDSLNRRLSEDESGCVAR
jgi:hypothetical protein